MTHRLTRRQALAGIASTAALGSLTGSVSVAHAAKPKSVAAIVTVYRRNSHADVIVGKILNGWEQNGGPGPALKLASLYVDQFPADDLSRGLAKEHGFPICDSIAEAITLGENRVAVDGVISVGEHGNYPWNNKRQHLYPRRRFFREITDAFAKHATVVPVFNDKHPGPQWEDAKWMYDRARELRVPFMAGSSLPVTYRKPDPRIPMGSQFDEIVAVGYSDPDTYGFHTLDVLQTIAERRRGGEAGVAEVQCLTAEQMWQPLDRGEISRELFNAALSVVPKTKTETLRSLTGDSVLLFRIRYRDGLRASVFMLNGVARGISVAVKPTGQSNPSALYVEERVEPRYPHFAFLLKAIETMVHTGRPTYPVERTMLSAGILDRALTSRAAGGTKILTPELTIGYRPVDYPHAPAPRLTTPPPSG